MTYDHWKTVNPADEFLGPEYLICDECGQVRCDFICENCEPAARRREESEMSEPCKMCLGSGEIVTDWGRYLHPESGDKGDEAVADCPDCYGVGSVPETSP